MGRRISVIRSGGALVAVALSVWTARAEPFLMYAPIPTPTLSQDYLAFPGAVPKFDLGKVDPGKFRKESTPTSLDTIEFGKSALRVDITDVVARPAPDTPDFTNVIVPLAPGQKRATPRYFGLKLSAPTH